MKKAFTLIELIVMIIIIGIFAILATAALKQAREKNNTVRTLNCDRYSDSTIEFLPVGCYSHFNINTRDLPGQIK